MSGSPESMYKDLLRNDVWTRVRLPAPPSTTGWCVNAVPANHIRGEGVSGGIHAGSFARRPRRPAHQPEAGTCTSPPSTTYWHTSPASTPHPTRTCALNVMPACGSPPAPDAHGPPGTTPQQPLVMQPAPIDAVAHSAPRRCAPMPRSPGLRAMPAPLRFTATGQLMHGSESSEVGMRICAEPGCPAVVQSGRCPAHRRYSPTTQRSAAERKRRSKAVAEWVSANGWICPGWDRPPHPSHDLTAAHRIPVAGGGADSPLTCLCRACNSRQGLATS